MTAPHGPTPHERHTPPDDTAEFSTLRRPVTPLPPPPGAFEDIRNRARGRRRARVAWAGVVVAGCVACGAVAANHTGTSTPTPSVAVGDDTPAQTRTGTTAPASPTATGGTSAAPREKTAADPTTCATDHLTITLGPGEGAAGSQYRPLRITNSGSTPCHLYGFPGVSLVDSAGKQIGKPADRHGSQASGKIVLKPGQQTSATLQIVNAANYGDQCTLTDAAGIRVYPPGEKHSKVVAAQNLTGCTSTSIETLTVTSYGVH